MKTFRKLGLDEEGTVLHLKLINTQVGPGCGEGRGSLLFLPLVFRTWKGCLVAGLLGRTGSRALSRLPLSFAHSTAQPFPSSASEVAEPRLRLCPIVGIHLGTLLGKGPGNRLVPRRYKEVWALLNLPPNLIPCTRASLQAVSPQSPATLTCPSHSPRGQRPYTEPQGALHSTILMSLEARWSLVICGSVPRQVTPWSPLLSSKAQNSGRERVCWSQGGSLGPSLKPTGG